MSASHTARKQNRTPLNSEEIFVCAADGNFLSHSWQYLLVSTLKSNDATKLAENIWPIGPMMCPSQSNLTDCVMDTDVLIP